ncbi:hypothetical protein AF363_23655 [Salmonella enterica subsp. enterica serovar Typhimurium]|nr:hypothetical protein AF363_23655 [Salmonella enterica subsp. enterica serovar Typhimurium]
MADDGTRSPAVATDLELASPHPTMRAGGYEFELPPIPCTIRLRDVLERMTDAELALQPGEIADQERERCRRKPCSTS